MGTIGGRQGSRGRLPAAVWVIAAALLAATQTACSRSGSEGAGQEGGRPVAVTGLKDKPCIQVNASQDTGPSSLFDVPASMMEGEFVAAVRKAKPQWKIYHETAEPACQANVFIDLKGLSYSLDRMQSYDEVRSTMGAGGGMSVYIPQHSEQPIATVALSDSVPGVAQLLAAGLEDAVRAARRPERLASNAKRLEEGKFCYSISAPNLERYEDLAQNLYYASERRLPTNFDGYRPSENCIPDFYVSFNHIPIRSSAGIEGQYGLLSLRVPGETRSRVYLSTGPGPSEALVRSINEMGRVLGSIERSAAQERVADRNWTDDEIMSVLETIVSTSKAHHAYYSIDPNYSGVLFNMRNSTDPKVREEGQRLTLERVQAQRDLPKMQRRGAEAITLLRSIMIADADRVRRVASRYERTLERPQREMLSDIIKAYTDVEPSMEGRSPFIAEANTVWRKKYD